MSYKILVTIYSESTSERIAEKAKRSFPEVKIYKYPVDQFHFTIKDENDKMAIGFLKYLSRFNDIGLNAYNEFDNEMSLNRVLIDIISPYVDMFSGMTYYESTVSSNKTINVNINQYNYKSIISLLSGDVKFTSLEVSESEEDFTLKIKLEEYFNDYFNLIKLFTYLSDKSIEYHFETHNWKLYEEDFMHLMTFYSVYYKAFT